MTNSRSYLADIEVEIHHRTERAVLVSTDGDHNNAVWLPLSIIEVEMIRGNLATVTLPQSMAEERGLV